MIRCGARGTRHRRGLPAVSAFCLLFSISHAEAQTPAGGLEVGVGIRRSGVSSLGTVDANETNPSGGSFRLFRSESRLEGITAVEARIGMRLTPTVRIEGAGSYGETDLLVRLSSDVEGIPDVSATGSVQRFTIEGAVTVDVRGRDRRAQPFVTAGGGYLRDLHDSQTLVESGGLGYVGGGVNVTLRSRPVATVKTVGLRLDGRALFVWRGVGFDDDINTNYAVGASAFFRF